MAVGAEVGAELWAEVLFIRVQYLYIDSERAHSRVRSSVVLFLIFLFTVLLLVFLDSRPAGRSANGSRSAGGRGNRGRSVILVIIFLLAIGLSMVSTCSLKVRQEHTHVIVIIILTIVRRRAASGDIHRSGAVLGRVRSG